MRHAGVCFSSRRLWSIADLLTPIAREQCILINHISLDYLKSLETRKVFSFLTDINSSHFVFVSRAEELLPNEGAERHDTLIGIVKRGVMQASVTPFVSVEKITVVLEQHIQARSMVITDSTKERRTAIFVLPLKEI